MLSLEQREATFDRTYRTVQKNYFDPKFNGRDWLSLAEARKDVILKSKDAEEFESLMHQLVRELGTSHTGFFHQNLRRVPGRLAISATFRKHQTPDGPRWMFQDVHEGGPAHAAGVEPVDLLVKIDAQTIIPPEQPSFPMGTVKCANNPEAGRPPGRHKRQRPEAEVAKTAVCGAAHGFIRGAG